jgi:hypothetical protein
MAMMKRGVDLSADLHFMATKHTLFKFNMPYTCSSLF